MVKCQFIKTYFIEKLVFLEKQKENESWHLSDAELF